MYGIRTLSEQVPGRCPLDHPAGVHDQHFLGVGGSQGEVMADHHQRRAELLLQAEQQVHDLRLRGDVEGGRGLVGDQQPRLAGQRDRDDNTLAHAARQLVRILVEAPFRGGQAHHPQQIDGSLVRLGPAEREVTLDRLGDLRADPHRRVQGPFRVLEDHRRVPAAVVPQVLFAAADELDAVEPDRAGHLGGPRQQAQHGVGADGLARTGLADDRQRPAGLDGEADSLHGVDDAAARTELHAQVGYVEQGSAWLGPGPGASRARSAHRRRGQATDPLPE